MFSSLIDLVLGKDTIDYEKHIEMHSRLINLSISLISRDPIDDRPLQEEYIKEYWKYTKRDEERLPENKKKLRAYVEKNN